MLSNKEIIEMAVREAQKCAREEGLEIGQTVAHPTDGCTYELRFVKGNIATVGLTAEQSPTGQPVEKIFPLDELFDPNVTKEKAVQMIVLEKTKGQPILN